MRKEYNNRWNAPLVNPPITEGEYNAAKAAKPIVKSDIAVLLETGVWTNPRSIFIPTIDGRESANG